MPPKAKPKPRSQDASKREVWEIRGKLWNQPVNELAAFLVAVGAEKCNVHGTNTVKLCCPFHNDNTPSAIINIENGFFKCYSASCSKYTKDFLTVVKTIDKGTYEHALDLYRSHFAGTIAKLRREDVKLLGAVDDEQRRVRLLSEALHTYACNIWLSDAVPESAKTTRTWLKQTRGIADIALISNIGMLPRDADLERIIIDLGGDRDDIHAIKSLIGQYLTSSYMDCVVYTYAESPDRVTGFKLRPPGDRKDAIRFIKVEDGDDAPTGVFGINLSGYVPLLSHDRIDKFTVVEGEHDQLALYQEQIKTGVIDHVYIAAGGAGHNGLDCLAAVGLTNGDIVGDDDNAGREWAEDLIKKSAKIGFRVFKYPQSLQAPQGGKTDPDDAVKRLGGAVVFAELKDKKNFTFAHEWCFERAAAKLATVDPQDVVRQLDVASEYGHALRSDAEQRAYADAIVKKFPKLQTTDILQQIVKIDDSPLAFVNRIVAALKRQFTPSHHDRDENRLYLWDNTSHEHLGIGLAQDNRAINLLRTRVGGVFYTWAKEEVGLPSYLPDVEDPAAGPTALSTCEARIEEACIQALSTIAGEVYGRWQNLDQGVHTASVESEGVGYIVTGNKQYKLTYKDMDIHKIERLGAPVDGNKVFWTRHHAGLLYTDVDQGWLEYDSVRAMRAKPKFTPEDALRKVKEILTEVFSFRHPEIDSTYCALMSVYPVVFDCMPKKVMTHVLGEWESGKSSLMCLLANNQQIKGYNLVTSAITTDNYTQAALFQLYGEKRVIVALDEFNDKDDGSRDSVNRQQILISLRGLATKGQAERVLGSKEGEGTIQKLNIPFWLLGNTIFNDPMDLSRFNRIELTKRENRANIGTALSKFGPNLFRELRHALFLGGLERIRYIKKEYDAIYRAGHENQLHLSRSIENLIPLAAIYTAFGGNGIEFIKSFTSTKVEIEAEKVERSPAETLFNALIYSPTLEVEIDQKPTRRSIASLLTRKDWHELINTSDRGVYFDSKTKVLGVVWAQATPCMLHHFTKSSAPTMRTMATQSRRHMSYQMAKGLGVVNRLRVYGMSGDEHQVTFLDINEFIDNIATAQEIVRKEQEAEQEAALQAQAAAAAANPGVNMPSNSPNTPKVGK